MRYEHIRKADLNLLPSFQALMEERNVSRAARRMFLSQPAMSRVVDRLQEMLGDEVLVRTSNGYEPTHRALEVYAQLEDVLPKIEMLLQGSEFKPGQAIDVFRIQASDWGATILLPGVIQILAKDAPGIQVEVMQVHAGFARLETAEVDLAIAPDFVVGQWVSKVGHTLRNEVIFKEKLVCLVRSGHPAARRRLTLQRYLKAQHVSLSPMRDLLRAPISFMDERQASLATALERLGQQRDVRATLPYFPPLGPIVENTDLIATIPFQLARRLKTSKTRIVPAPIELQGFDYCQIWHARDDANSLHKWMRGLVRSVAARIARIST
jgi:DNA-binding transcriptional LysR family regulator